MNANDPRLTAHALGEADAESAGIIAHDPALAAEAAEIERFAEHLRTEFQAEPAHPLREEQRAAVFAAAKVAAGPAHWWQRVSVVGAAAACVMLALGSMAYFQARYVKDLRTAVQNDRPAPHGMTISFTDNETHQSHDEPVVAPKPRVVEAQPNYSSPAPAPVILLSEKSAKAPAATATPALAAKATPAPVKKVAPSGTLPADPPRMNASPLRPSPKPRSR